MSPDMLLGFVGRGGGWGVSIDDDRAVEGLWWRGDDDDDVR